MSRKIKSSIVIIATAIIALITIVLSNNTTSIYTNFNSLYLSDKKYEALIASLNKSETPLSTDIYMNDQKLIYDSDTNTFYYSLIQDDSSSYTPYIEIKNDADEDTSLNIGLYGEPISDELIASNQSITLILYDNNSVSVSYLKCTTLPIMNISIDDATVQELGLDNTYDLVSYTGTTIYLYDNQADFDGASRTIITDAKVRRHGQSTVGYPLKGYRISLLADKNNLDGDNNKEDLLGLREDDDWILSASYRDYEKVRNVFSMNLWYESFTKENEWNVNNSTQYKFVELFFNGHYHGLYSLCYRIDSKELSTTEGESIFKKKDWTLSEYDTELTYQEYADGSGGVYTLPGYSLKYGDVEDYNNLLQLYVNMNYSTDCNVVRMTSDVTNSIDLWLFYKLTQAVDNVYIGNAKNMYVTVKSSDTGIAGQKLLFTPWDMDQTWRYTSEATVGQYSNPFYDLPIEWGTTYRLLSMGDETIKDEIKARYATLRSDAWSEDAILTLLEEYQNEIYNSGAFARTQEAFPEGSYNDASVGLTEFTDYVLKRLAAMDEYINAL
ncbi:MAG: hypothetical protein E7274_02710 [Pseudobutyrivibrio ruminis]|uniref:CotH kinase family protein n=1 Tax=Pseudobutyrivibrio ruminis TaxID=46206 RepID=UPI0026EDA6EB|nr:CotH kinase family protein [Pseudobutyrivibrio ruminis]MBE5912955.1 hypothetical protein [Pseudobutyrivibrio ruminis]